MPLRTQAGATPASVTTTTVAFPAAVSAGDLLVAVVRTGTAAAVSSISDSVNGAWTVLAAVANGAGEDFVAYFVNSGAGTPTVTVNFGAASSPQISIAAFSNVLTASPLDQTGAGATGASGTSLAADSVTTTHANEIVIGFFSQGATETFSQSGAWAIVSGNGTPTARSVIVYQEVTSTGTYQPAVTSNSSAAWIGQTLSFQQAGGASFDPSAVPWTVPYQPPVTTSVVGF